MTEPEYELKPDAKVEAYSPTEKVIERLIYRIHRLEAAEDAINRRLKRLEKKLPQAVADLPTSRG